MNPRSANLMAVAAMAMMGAGLAQASMPAPRKGSNRDHKPAPPRLGTALAREIAAHNKAVDRSKAEKKALKYCNPDHLGK